MRHESRSCNVRRKQESKWWWEVREQEKVKSRRQNPICRFNCICLYVWCRGLQHGYNKNGEEGREIEESGGRSKHELSTVIYMNEN